MPPTCHPASPCLQPVIPQARASNLRPWSPHCCRLSQEGMPPGFASQQDPNWPRWDSSSMSVGRKRAGQGFRGPFLHFISSGVVWTKTLKQRLSAGNLFPRTRCPLQLPGNVSWAICSLKKYLFSAYCMPGYILCPGDGRANKTETSPSLWLPS